MEKTIDEIREILEEGPINLEGLEKKLKIKPEHKEYFKMYVDSVLEDKLIKYDEEKGVYML